MREALGIEALNALDVELGRLARAGGILRLSLGRGLEALVRQGGHHELGFSSCEAYALERCERSSRWVQECRALARRLEGLPRLRAGLLTGRVAWSAAQIAAAFATEESDAEWLALAETLTVRELGALACEATTTTRRSSSRGPDVETCTCTGSSIALTDELLSETATAPPEELSSSMASAAWEAEPPEELRTLTATVDRADGWLFEAATRVVEHIAGARDADTVVEGLVAEAFATMQPWLPRNEATEPGQGEGDPEGAAQRTWEEQLRRWREEAEEMCEERWRCAGLEGVPIRRNADIECVPGTELPCFLGTAESIDAELRRVARELASRELVTGQRAEAFWKADGWRRLGYATETQYCRERLGQGLSAVKGKRALARAAARLPALGRAVEAGEVGHEAARVVSRVADSATVDAWLERARHRTVRHLREEVDATMLLADLSGRPRIPPDEGLMQEVEELQRRILSGSAFGAKSNDGDEDDATTDRDTMTGKVAASDAGGTDAGGTDAGGTDAGGTDAGGTDAGGTDAGGTDAGGTDGAGAELEDRTRGSGPVGGRMSAPGVATADGCAPQAGRMSAPRASGSPRRGAARITLRLRVRMGTHRWYRWLEGVFLRRFGQRLPFLRFACQALLETWKPALGAKGAYAGIYARDRYRCRSPVCTRRDVTPHHLVFRCRGGDDSHDNVIALCVWCHLQGIHEGRLGADAPASNPLFRVGRSGHTVVNGRHRERRAG